jgi:hypothetical protein
MGRMNLAVKVRTDTKVPVFQFETETDVSGFYMARQPDTDMIRTWEVPGTAHADYWLASRIPEAERPETVPQGADFLLCDTGNKGPHYITLRAALKALDNWVKDGIAPPKAEVLAMEGSKILKDEHDNALGGVRTPQVDVPISNLRPSPAPGGSAQDGADTGAGGCNIKDAACTIFGVTVPFTPEKLQELYVDHDDYVTKFKASAEDTVKKGFMLREEADALIQKAIDSPVPAAYSDVW